MKKKKHTYNVRLVKLHQSYTIQEIANLYGLHPNAVRKWIKEGLKVIARERPFLIHSSDLIAFLKNKQMAKKKPCKDDEIFCCKCQKPQKPWEGVVDIKILNSNQLRIIGICLLCNATLNRMGAVKKLPEYQKLFNVQTIQERHILWGSDPNGMCYLKEEMKNE